MVSASDKRLAQEYSPLQSVLGGHLGENAENVRSDLWVLACSGKRRSIIGSNLLPGDGGSNGSQLNGIRNDDGDEVRLQAISVDIELRDDRVSVVQVFNLLEGHIFALCEFHDILPFPEFE